MRTCKCCREKFSDDESPFDGKNIAGKGVAMMGYGSKYDWNIYQFTLVEGWYCYDCLDREVAQGLCQPLLEWKNCKVHPLEVFMPKKAGSLEVDEEQGRKNWLRLIGRLGLTEEDFKQ